MVVLLVLLLGLRSNRTERRWLGRGGDGAACVVDGVEEVRTDGEEGRWVNRLERPNGLSPVFALAQNIGSDLIEDLLAG